MEKNTHSAIFLVIGTLLVAVLFIAGLYPFEFYPPNRVAWSPDRNGLDFSSPGVVFGTQPLKGQGGAIPFRDSLSIELVVEPASIPTNSMHLLSFTDAKAETEHLVISSWKGALIVQAPEQRPARTIGVKNVFRENTPVVVVVTASQDRAQVFVNGEQRARFRINDFAGFQAGARLVLGNSLAGQHQFPGRITGVGLYDRTLLPQEIAADAHTWERSALARTGTAVALYVFDEKSGAIVRDNSGNRNDLVIPAVFSVLKKPVFTTPVQDYRPSPSYVKDIALNILGFIPFSFFLAFYLIAIRQWPRLRTAAVVVLAGLSISMTIEFIQIYLPNRHSSMTDVVTNLTGSLLGVLLVLAVFQKRRANKPQP